MTAKEKALEQMKLNLKLFPSAMLARYSTWAACVKASEYQIRLESDITRLEKLSGMSMSELIFLFQQGYTLQPPSDKPFEELGMFGIDCGGYFGSAEGEDYNG